MLSQPDTDCDDGPRRGAAPTQRLCVATREVRPLDDLLRFVAAPDGVVVPDLKRRLPGRGVWVSATRSALAIAARQNLFRRGLRADVAVPADLAERIDALMVRALLDALGMAYKSGDAVLGFTRVMRSIETSSPVALVHACDAARDGGEKIRGAAAARAGAAAIVRIDAFSMAQLDLAFGRPNVVHAALLEGPASKTVLRRWRMLARFRAAE
ncbi:MAG: RNA-binding protein [Proteobacteria bacterium]|nr:RNA-binding protein [Pseudomonadota bacterium]